MDIKEVVLSWGPSTNFARKPALATLVLVFRQNSSRAPW